MHNSLCSGIRVSYFVRPSSFLVVALVFLALMFFAFPFTVKAFAPDEAVSPSTTTDPQTAASSSIKDRAEGVVRVTAYESLSAFEKIDIWRAQKSLSFSSSSQNIMERIIAGSATSSRLRSRDISPFDTALEGVFGLDILRVPFLYLQLLAYLLVGVIFLHPIIFFLLLVLIAIRFLFYLWSFIYR